MGLKNELVHVSLLWKIGKLLVLPPPPPRFFLKDLVEGYAQTIWAWAFMCGGVSFNDCFYFTRNYRYIQTV
jgi:hypothetical protein